VSIKAVAGEVWMVDFGLVAKQRPVLVLAFPEPQDARALVVVVPLTSLVHEVDRTCACLMSLKWSIPQNLIG